MRTQYHSMPLSHTEYRSRVKSGCGFHHQRGHRAAGEELPQAAPARALLQGVRCDDAHAASPNAVCAVPRPAAA
jgi:hypothetical protein